MYFVEDAVTSLPVLSQEKMRVSVARLIMHIVTTRGGDKPKHWVTMKLKRSTKLKRPTIDKLYKKAASDGSQSDIAQKVTFYCSESNLRLLK